MLNRRFNRGRGDMFKIRISGAFLWVILSVPLIGGSKSLLWSRDSNDHRYNSLIHYEADGSAIINIPPLSFSFPIEFSKNDIESEETREEIFSSSTQVFWLEINEGEDVRVEMLGWGTDEKKDKDRSSIIRWRWGEDLKWRGKWLKPLIIDHYPHSSVVDEVKLKISYQNKVSIGNKFSFPIKTIERIWGEIPIPSRDRTQEGTSGAWIYVIPENARVREIVTHLANWRRREGYP
ncbi:MAG: hypothetical protein ACK4OO_04140, partial [bacterium]